MSLPDKQIKFITNTAKTAQEAKDMVGVIYKHNRLKRIKKFWETKSIKDILQTKLTPQP